MNVKMVSITLYLAMDAKAVIAIQSEALTHLANETPVNAIVNQALLGKNKQNNIFSESNYLFFFNLNFLDCVVINVHHMNTDFLTKVVVRAIAM